MNMKRIFPYLLTVLLSLSGCTIIAHNGELSALGDYSRDKDNQHRLVKSIDDHYDAMTKAIDQKAIGNYKDETSFVYSFWDPISKKDLSDGTQRWLYRYAIFRFAKDKVYVYFDRSGKMIKWEKIPCPSYF